MKLFHHIIVFFSIMLIFSSCTSSTIIPFYILVDCNDTLTSYNITYDTEVHNLETDRQLSIPGSATNLYAPRPVTVYKSTQSSPVVDFLPITIHRIEGLSECSMYIIPVNLEVNEELDNYHFETDKIQAQDEIFDWLIDRSIGHITLPKNASEAIFKLKIK